MATRNAGTLVLVRGPVATARGHSASGARSRRWRSALVALAAFGALLGLAFLAGTPRDDGAQLRRLPEGVRAALYQRTLLDVTSVCSTPAAADGGVLREHCLAQARFVMVFPECDGDCRAAARAVLPRPPR